MGYALRLLPPSTEVQEVKIFLREEPDHRRHDGEGAEGRKEHAERDEPAELDERHEVRDDEHEEAAEHHEHIFDSYTSSCLNKIKSTLNITNYIFPRPEGSG